MCDEREEGEGGRASPLATAVVAPIVPRQHSALVDGNKREGKKGEGES